MKRCHELLHVVALALSVAMLQAFSSDARAGSPKKPTSQKTHERIGNVVSAAASYILIRTKKGEQFKYFVTPATIFGEKNSGKTVADFKPGNLVRVIYGQGEGNQITARQVLWVTHSAHRRKQ